MIVEEFRKEIARGQRFEFGKNWQRFLYYRKHGYSLDRLVTRDGGCNEFVFRKQ